MEIPSVRVLVVGDSGVGKTSLLQSICSRATANQSNSYSYHEKGSTTSTPLAPPTRWTTGCDLHLLVSLDTVSDTSGSKKYEWEAYFDKNGLYEYVV
jgi:GTPase SAR1 family protein